MPPALYDKLVALVGVEVSIRVKLDGKKRENGSDSRDFDLEGPSDVPLPAWDGRLLRAIIACNRRWPRYRLSRRRIARCKPGSNAGDDFACNTCGEGEL